MAEEKRIIKLPHNLILEDRHSLNVSGVSDVDSFDEQTIVLFTDLGELTVRGQNLQINRFSNESGELNMEGKIVSLSYSDEAPKNTGLFGRLFK